MGTHSARSCRTCRSQWVACMLNAGICIVLPRHASYAGRGEMLQDDAGPDTVISMSLRLRVCMMPMHAV